MGSSNVRVDVFDAVAIVRVNVFNAVAIVTGDGDPRFRLRVPAPSGHTMFRMWWFSSRGKPEGSPSFATFPAKNPGGVDLEPMSATARTGSKELAVGEKD